MANGGAFNRAINLGVDMGALQPLLNVGAQMANGTYQPQAAASMASASLPGTAPNAPPPGVAPTGTAPMYQPVTGPNVGQTSANTYNTAVGATAQGMGFTPNQVTPNTVAGTNMQQYQNPFQQQVIDASMADMNMAKMLTLSSRPLPLSMNPHLPLPHGVVKSPRSKNRKPGTPPQENGSFSPNWDNIDATCAFSE